MLTRKEIEQKIAGIIKEQILPLYKGYVPDGEYLTLSYLKGTISFNNDWWEMDEAIREDYKVDYFENLNKEDDDA